MSVKDLLPFSWLLFNHVNCYEKQIVAHNVRGNKEECKKILQIKKDENSRETMMKVQIASRWRGSAGLCPKALSPKTQVVVICLRSATGFNGIQLLQSHSLQVFPLNLNRAIQHRGEE